MLPFGAGLAGKFRGAKVVYHLHETAIRPALLKKFLRLMIKICASRIIYVSKFLQREEDVEGVMGVTIYNSLSDEFQSRALATPYRHMHAGKFNVLMLASLRAYKGVNEFVALATTLASNEKVTFTLVASASAAEIDAYFAGTPLPANLLVNAARADVLDFYCNASLVVNLSHVDGCAETFGLTILEAMAFGIPTIVPPIGGPIELVTDGVEGFHIDSRKIDILASTITSLADDAELCFQHSSHARSKASHFSTVNFRNNIFKVLDEL